jgi:hypothetical protein
MDVTYATYAQKNPALVALPPDVLGRSGVSSDNKKASTRLAFSLR